jgi:hypothetical protein
MDLEAKKSTIDVTVKYVAGAPFHQKDAPRHETLGQLKTRAMQHFGLEETQGPQFQKVYFLHGQHGRIENLAQTLGDYAGHAEHVEFKLVEQIHQGFEGPSPGADALLFEDHFLETRASEDAARWELHHADWLEVWAIQSSRAHPEQRFQARLRWQRYPHEAPSLKYRDPQTGRLDNSRAWPVLPGFRPNSLDACVNFCSEGFAIHPEWVSDPRFRWDPRGNVLLRVLILLQVRLDELFGGRFAG